MIHSLLLPLVPRKAARSLQARPVWWPGLLVLAALTVATRIVEWPSVVQCVLAHLPPTATQADQEWVRSVLSRELMVRCPMTILLCFGTVSFFSGLLHYMGRAQRFPRRPRYEHLFALTASAACIPALAELSIVALKAWTGAGTSIPSLAWMAGLWGVHDFVVNALLEAVSLTAVWFVVVIGSALSVFFACSLRRALLFATGAWAVAILTNLWLLRMTAEALHLRV
jgi:hypothetical protein